MFLIGRTRLGIYTPLSSLAMAVGNWTHIEEDVIIKASKDTEQLALAGASFGMQFYDTATSEVFTFPLLGSDFTTARTGELHFFLFQLSMTASLLIVSLRTEIRHPGVCGYGLLGGMQAANETSWKHPSTLHCRIHNFIIGTDLLGISENTIPTGAPS